MGWSKFSKDKIDSCQREDDVYDFHWSVVDRNVGGEQVQVTRKEDDEEEELRNSWIEEETAEFTWDFPERPRTDFVVQILEIRSMIAKRWLMSPASRKTFIFSYPNLKKRKKNTGRVFASDNKEVVKWRNCSSHQDTIWGLSRLCQQEIHRRKYTRIKIQNKNLIFTKLLKKWWEF